MGETEDWLLSGPSWIEYLTRTEIIRQGKDKGEVVDSKKRMLSDPLVEDLISEVSEWPGYPIKRHNDARHPLHKLVFLSEIGLDRNDHGIDEIAGKVMSNVSPEGPFQIRTQLYKRWMGRDGIEMLWFMCDAPLILYSMVKLGYGDDERVGYGIRALVERIEDNGWRCGGSPDLGKFKGPGRRESMCPYASLLMMRLLSTRGDLRDSEEARTGAEALLQRWEMRGKEKPFLFGIGTDFRKLKAPMIWYDILHMTNVLTRFQFLKGDPRMDEMLDVLRSKEVNGKYTPESVWMAWKGWDFGQKKEPSRYITFKVKTILDRWDGY